jgi:DNA invertase Pin-like site-specific DNA recombinase
VNVAIYARCSTFKQDTENQLAQLREFAGKQDWTVFREYVDYESGSKSDRVQFQQMFVDASQRRFDLALFWALDRFSREGVLQTLTHLNRLESYGTHFRSFTEPYFDSCGVFKDAVLAIMATLARQERIKRAERTRAGLAIARARGRVLGRPKVKIRPEAVVHLRSQGQSFRAISRTLNISEASVRRLAGASETSVQPRL